MAARYASICRRGTYVHEDWDLATVVLLAISSQALADKGGKGPKHKGPKENFHAGSSQAAVVYFRPADVQVIHRYYTPQPLPPGLQKKLVRSGRLPPGWMKSYRPFPVVVESQLGPICTSCVRGYYGPYAVVVDKRTSILYDIAQLTADILR